VRARTLLISINNRGMATLSARALAAVYTRSLDNGGYDGELLEIPAPTKAVKSPPEA